jgi:hypothetical protein
MRKARIQKYWKVADVPTISLYFICITYDDFRTPLHVNVSALIVGLRHGFRPLGFVL